MTNEKSKYDGVVVDEEFVDETLDAIANAPRHWDAEDERWDYDGGLFKAIDDIGKSYNPDYATFREALHNLMMNAKSIEWEKVEDITGITPKVKDYVIEGYQRGIMHFIKSLEFRHSF